MYSLATSFLPSCLCFWELCKLIHVALFLLMYIASHCMCLPQIYCLFILLLGDIEVVSILLLLQYWEWHSYTHPEHGDCVHSGTVSQSVPCLLSFTRYCQITVHSDFVNFCSPQQCEGLPLHHILDITLMLSNFYFVSLNFEIISSLQESCKNSSLYLPFRVTNLFCHICFLAHIKFYMILYTLLYKFFS